MRMNRCGFSVECLAVTAAWFVAGAPTQAQTELLHANGPMPSFEVATIKPSAGHMPPLAGSLTILTTTKRLIQLAYEIPAGSDGRVIGGPAWINSDMYVIQAKVPDDVRAKQQSMPEAERRAQLGLMEQSLLASRFGLKAHIETREMPVYELVVAKGGPKLTVTKTPPTESRVRSRHVEQGMELDVKGMTLEDWLRNPVAGMNDRPIVDKTDLRSRYDFTLDWKPSQDGTTPSDNAMPSNDNPSIFTALQEQLGLKLVTAKGMVEVVVIDSIERPSEN